MNALRIHPHTSLSGCFLDIPMSVGIVDPRANPTQLNTVEFLWDPSKRTSVFIQVVLFLYLICLDELFLLKGLSQTVWMVDVHWSELCFFGFRFIASAQSSQCASMVVRREYHFGSKSTRLRRTKQESTVNTYTQPAAKSKSSRWEQNTYNSYWFSSRVAEVNSAEEINCTLLISCWTIHSYVAWPKTHTHYL